MHRSRPAPFVLVLALTGCAAGDRMPPAGGPSPEPAAEADAGPALGADAGAEPPGDPPADDPPVPPPAEDPPAPGGETAWTWVNPAPSANSLFAVAFAGASVGLAAGSKSLLRTDDGGRTWSPATPPLDHVDAMCFTDARRVIAAGIDLIPGGVSRVAASDDGGGTWHPVDLPAPRMVVMDLHCDGAFAAIVGSDGTVLVSEDAGASWRARPLPDGAGVLLHAVQVRGRTLQVVGPGAFRRSDDLGVSWAPPERAPAGDYAGVAFADDRTGLAVGWGEAIARTTDGGVTWDVVRTGRDAYLRRVRFLDERHALAFGQYGAMLASDDGGVTWTETSPNPIPWYFAVASAGADVWAVGTRGVVFHSSDRGRTWTPQTRGYLAAFVRAHFPSPTTGFAVGELGGIVRTRDGGRTWEISLGSHPAYTAASLRLGLLGNSLRDVFFVDQRQGWAVGDPPRDDAGRAIGEAVILRTADGGDTWVPQPSGLDGGLKAVGFANERVGYAVGLSMVLKTEDGGASWSPIARLSGGLTDVAVRSEHELWISSWNGLHHSVDGGGTFVPRERDLLAYDIRFHGAFGVATGGDFRITDDGGATWRPVAPPAGDGLPMAAAFDPELRVGVAVLTGGTILRTADGGARWAREAWPTFNSLFDVQWAGDGFVAFGEFGSILRGPAAPP